MKRNKILFTTIDCKRLVPSKGESFKVARISSKQAKVCKIDLRN